MNKVQISRLVMNLGYISLLLVLALSTWASKPEELQGNALVAGVIFFLVKSAPLLLFIPGLIKGSSRNAAWLCYMTLIYFVFAVLFFFTKGCELWGGLMTLSTMVLFVSAMIFTRWKKVEEQALEQAQ